MRSTFAAYWLRVAALSCGVAFLLSACGGDDTGGAGGGTGGGAGTGGGGGTGGVAQDGAAGTGGTAGQGGARPDASSDAASTGGNAGAGGSDGQAGTGGTAGRDGSTAEAGPDGAIGGPLGLPWRSFLPLTSVASGDGTSGGITPDVSGNNYNATFFGSSLSFADPGVTLAGSGLELVLVPAKASVPAIDVTGSFSVSAWVSLSNTGGFRTVVSGEGQNVSSFYLQKRADTNSWAFAQLATDATTAAGCIVPPPPPDGGLPAGVVGRVTPVANTFYHLVATRNATTGEDILYVNGAESGRLNCAAGWADTGIAGIGHGVFGSARVDNVAGTIGEVGLINRVLTPAEVAMLYALGHAGASAPDAATADASDGSVVDVGTADRSDANAAETSANDANASDGTASDGSASDARDGNVAESSTDAPADAAGQ